MVEEEAAVTTMVTTTGAVAAAVEEEVVEVVVEEAAAVTMMVTTTDVAAAAAAGRKSGSHQLNTTMEVGKTATLLARTVVVAGGKVFEAIHENETKIFNTAATTRPNLVLFLSSPFLSLSHARTRSLALHRTKS